MRCILLLPSPNTTRIRLIVSMFFIMLFFGQCQSQFHPPQVEITEADTVGYDFIDQERNEIENAGYLEPFFEKLYRQRTQGGQKISIVHIGDSHILGNYITKEVRARMQNAFGDGGRGMIFPYRLAGTNGPKDFLVSTNARWYGSSCQRILSPETPFGVAGFSLESTKLNSELSFRLRDTATSETRLFTKVIVFQHKLPAQYDIEVVDETTDQKAGPFLENQYAQTFYFDRPVGQMTLKTRKLTSQQKRFTLDGISLENELSGVIYHSIGVNGAKYQDFVRAKYFARQVAELQPDLIILSFGTNEAQGKVDAGYLTNSISDLVTQLLEHSPNALILFTTPADSYLRKKGFNPHLADLCGIVRNYALKKGYALWDLYELTGGRESAQQWKSRGLMSSDSVHFTKAGYAIQGKLLYQSLIRGYNGFVHSKP
ncbi:MAG: hypothetical protein H6575_10055 [Lewinellaceae bacterium]|nr:hypothetical protein [Saprospiraceae bacterium]MCB9354894.1 hypothetical protein [Lewinellaceae bacterium]